MQADYALGIDVGTTFTAAATHREGRTEIAALGNHAPPVPSLVFLREDGEILVGDAAERRGMAEPHRLAREFKRRVGDDTPILLAGTPYSAERLIAAILHEVEVTVAAREGGDPSAVAVSHPANWGAFKTDLLRQACGLAGLRDVSLVSEPVAAAVHYSSTERLEPGATVAVYDLGGGTFDAAILRKTGGGFTTLGEPEGIERLGGIDFDAAVFAHVRKALGGVLDDVNGDDPSVRAGLARLRQDCVAAKEALSFDTDATVNVSLPGVQTQVRLTRPEFEAMIRPALLETIAALRRATVSAGVAPTSLSAVLLVGGSSRIPLVAEMVAAELGRPVAVDVHPKHAVALGAALLAAGDQGQTVGPVVPPPPAPAEASQTSAAVAPVVPVRGDQPARPGGRRAAMVIGAVVALAVLALGAAALASRGGDDSSSDTSDASSSEETTAESSVASPCGSASGRCSSITEITIENGAYVARYQTTGFDPIIYVEGSKGSPEDHHVHFFFDTTTPDNAGSNGSNPGEWMVWDRESGGGELRFDGYRATDRKSASRMCISVADKDHAVEASSGSCVDLPPDPAATSRRTNTSQRRAVTTRQTTTTARATTTANPRGTSTTGSG